MRCFSCGNDLAPGGRFCDRCGAPVQASAGGSGLVVGRDPSCDIALEPNDTRVSRRHARITPVGGGRYRIEDLGSANGVQVNGRPTQAAEFGPGDRISFGSYLLDLALLSRTRQEHGGSPVQAQGRSGSVPGGWLTMGRDPTCEIVLPMHANGVSRRHARVRDLGGDKYEIKDLGSANGMLVNGARVVAAVVGPQDQVALGSTSVDLRSLVASAHGGRPHQPGPPRSARSPAHAGHRKSAAAPRQEEPRPPARDAAPVRRNAPPPRQRSYGGWIFLACLLGLIGFVFYNLSTAPAQARTLAAACVERRVESRCSKAQDPKSIDSLLNDQSAVQGCQAECDQVCQLGEMIGDPFSCRSACRGLDSRHDDLILADCVSSREMAAYESWKEDERRKKALAQQRAADERKRKEAEKARASSSRSSSSPLSSLRSSTSSRSSSSSGRASGVINSTAGGFVDGVNKHYLGEENVDESTRTMQIEATKYVLGVGNIDSLMDATIDAAEGTSRGR